MTRDISAQPKTTNTINKLSLPSGPPTFKQQCDDVIAFCYRAHQLSVDSAYRCGISSALFEKLSFGPGTSPITELSNEARRKLLAEASEEIKRVAPGHSGFIPDFIGFAGTVRQRFHRFITEGSDPVSSTSTGDNFGHPTSVAAMVSHILVDTLANARHMEQKQLAIVLLSALSGYIKDSMPKVSAQISDAHSQVFQSEMDSTTPFTLR